MPACYKINAVTANNQLLKQWPWYIIIQPIHPDLTFANITSIAIFSYFRKYFVAIHKNDENIGFPG
jgi:hypothetical protein